MIQNSIKCIQRVNNPKLRCILLTGLNFSTLYSKSQSRFMCRGTIPQSRPISTHSYRLNLNNDSTSNDEKLSNIPMELRREALSKELEYYNDLITECMSLQKRPDDTGIQMLWKSISKIIRQYEKLKYAKVLSKANVAHFVECCHRFVRLRRQVQTFKKMKPDPANDFTVPMMESIGKVVLSLGKDLADGTTTISPFGAMHLITMIVEMNQYPHAIKIWEDVMESEGVNVEAFSSEKVLGALINAMTASDVPLKEIERIYDYRQADDIGIEAAMITAYLKAGEDSTALTKYENFIKLYPKEESYLSRVHSSFVAYSKSAPIAETFFNEATSRKLPYEVVLRVNFVAQFLRNIWVDTNDFPKVFDYWKKYLVYLGKTNLGILSAINKAFIEIYFQRYPSQSVEALEYLKQIIRSYHDIRKTTDEPFVNNILSLATIWKDAEIINALAESYSIFHIPRTAVSYRIMLNAFAYIPVTEERILNEWNNLICCVDEDRTKILTWLDFSALIQATLANPALDESGSRARLFLKLWKLYNNYISDDRTRYNLSVMAIRHQPSIEYHLTHDSILEKLDVSDIEVPHLHTMKRNLL